MHYVPIYQIRSLDPISLNPTLLPAARHYLMTCSPAKVIHKYRAKRHISLCRNECKIRSARYLVIGGSAPSEWVISLLGNKWLIHSTAELQQSEAFTNENIQNQEKEKSLNSWNHAIPKTTYFCWLQTPSHTCVPHWKSQIAVVAKP